MTRQPRVLLMNKQNASLKKSQFTLSQGMLKKGDDDDEVNDEVRSSASQNRVTATLCTEEFFLRTQYF